MPKYLVIQALGLALAALFPRLLADIMPPALCFILVSALVAGASYVLLTRWAFPTDKEKA